MLRGVVDVIRFGIESFFDIIFSFWVVKVFGDVFVVWIVGFNVLVIDIGWSSICWCCRRIFGVIGVGVFSVVRWVRVVFVSRNVFGLGFGVGGEIVVFVGGFSGERFGGDGISVFDFCGGVFVEVDFLVFVGSFVGRYGGYKGELGWWSC